MAVGVVGSLERVLSQNHECMCRTCQSLRAQCWGEVFLLWALYFLLALKFIHVMQTEYL